MATYGGRYKGRANTGSKDYESFKSNVDSDIKKKKEKDAFREANTIKPDYYFQGQKMEEKDYNMAVMTAKGNKGKIMPGTSPALDQLAKKQEAESIQSQAQANMQDLAKQNQVAQAQEEILNAGKTTEETIAMTGNPGQIQPIGQTGQISTQDTTGSMQQQGELNTMEQLNQVTTLTRADIIIESMNKRNADLGGESYTEAFNRGGLDSASPLLSFAATGISAVKSIWDKQGFNMGLRLAKDSFDNFNDAARLNLEGIKAGESPEQAIRNIANMETALGKFESETKRTGMLSLAYWADGGKGANLESEIALQKEILADIKQDTLDAIALKKRADMIANYGL